MKTKSFIIGALAVAAIAFVGCNKIDVTVEPSNDNGTPFEFTASEVSTKTTFDGTHTNWKSGDKVSLFHAVAGSNTYVSDGAFTTSENARTVTFSGTLAGELTEDYYDWYAIYPQSNSIGTPANTTGPGYVTIGSTKSGVQKQTGNSNMTHIAGSNYPVAGKSLNVAKETKPEISMSHLTSVIAVKVTNGLTTPITVSEISFTGTERISGTFYIDFVSSPVVYTSSGDEYTSESETLQVVSGSEIAAGGNATFYLAVKPFTAPAASTLSVSVAANNGTQVFNKVLGSAATFAAGKINTLNVSYDKELVLNLPLEDDMSWADTGTASDGALVTASDFPKNGSDEPLYASSNSAYKGAGGLKLGTSSLRGDITTVKLDLSSAYTIIVSAKAYGSDESTLQVFVDGTQVGSDATLYNEFVEYVYKPGAATASSNVKVKIDGKRGYINSIRIISGTDYTAKPVIHLVTTPAALTSAAGNASITYQIINPTGASVSASVAEDWISDFDYSVANTVKFDYTENTGDQRSQNLTLSYTGADNKVVSITQNGASSPTEVTLNIGTYASANSWVNETKYSSVTIDSYVSISGNTYNNNGKYYTSNNSWRHYEGDSQTLTLTATGGKTLKSVIFTYANGNNGRIVYNETQYSTGTSISLSGTSASFTVGHASGTKNGNIQITSIKVVYNN